MIVLGTFRNSWEAGVAVGQTVIVPNETCRSWPTLAFVSTSMARNGFEQQVPPPVPDQIFKYFAHIHAEWAEVNKWGCLKPAVTPAEPWHPHMINGIMLSSFFSLFSKWRTVWGRLIKTLKLLLVQPSNEALHRFTLYHPVWNQGMETNGA